MITKFKDGVITFDGTSRDMILSWFGKTIDKEGYIVEMKDPSQRVLTPEGETISIDEFAGIRKGSEIYVKNDLPSLIRLLDSLG